MSTTEQNKNDPPVENSKNKEVAALDGGVGGTFCFSGTACRPIPPFLLKIHDMLDNSGANCSVISWGCHGTSFVVTNPHSFSDNVLPMYFRHNNFQSFIAQLNSYGFRKISWEHWEYSHEYFRKGERHLLSNIKRRNQIPRPFSSDTAMICGGAHMDVAKEVQVMMIEHEQMKVEIETLNDKQEALERKLASLKEQATAINAEKGGMGIMGMAEGLLRKRKLEQTEKHCSEFIMSEHFKEGGCKTTTSEALDDDQTNYNTLISLEDMFGESSSSDWVAYLKGFLEKDNNHLKS